MGLDEGVQLLALKQLFQELVLFLHVHLTVEAAGTTAATFRACAAHEVEQVANDGICKWNDSCKNLRAQSVISFVYSKHFKKECLRLTSVVGITWCPRGRLLLARQRRRDGLLVLRLHRGRERRQHQGGMIGHESRGGVELGWRGLADPAAAAAVAVVLHADDDDDDGDDDDDDDGDDDDDDDDEEEEDDDGDSEDSFSFPGINTNQCHHYKLPLLALRPLLFLSLARRTR